MEVSYGQFRQLIMQDAVESVVMASGKYTFTLKEGYSCLLYTSGVPVDVAGAHPADCRYGEQILNKRGSVRLDGASFVNNM